MLSDSSREGGHIFALDNGLLDVMAHSQLAKTEKFCYSASVVLKKKKLGGVQTHHLAQ